MPFIVPSTGEIWQRIKGALRVYLPGTDAWIEPNNLSIQGRVFSLALKDVYRRIEYLYRQLFATTADGFHLEFRHAFDLGITRKTSSAGVGSIVITQKSPTVIVPRGAIRLDRGDGVTYLSQIEAIPDAFGQSLIVFKADQTGAITNEAANVSLQFDAATLANYPSLDSAVVGPAGIGGAADPESDDDLRVRVLFRKRFPPAGGSASDYVNWALDVAGCTRAFCSPFNPKDDGVTVFPLFDNTRTDGIPVEADLDVVAAYIETVRPVTADVFVVAAQALVVPIEIAGLGQADTPANRETILAQLASIFRKRSAVATANLPFTFSREWGSEGVARAVGVAPFRIVSPAGDIKTPIGQIPTLGGITYDS